MRHRKHNHQLGVKTAHRTSMLANLCCSLIENGRIKTTLARARAMRPTIEKIVTLAKKAHLAQDTAKKVHYRRLAISRLRNTKAIRKLFDEIVEQFVSRQGGYTRIYKLAMPRLGDASEMALIEFVEEAANKKKKNKAKKTARKSILEKEESKAVREENEVIELTPETTEEEADLSIEEIREAEPNSEDEPAPFENSADGTNDETVEQTEAEDSSASQDQAEGKDEESKDS